jgi:serine phosphatase RsbU (regulator of sigma subunit)
MRVRVEPPDGAPLDTALTETSVLIGRSPTANLVLPDLSVSRQHARLVRKGTRWRVEALSPTNPTFVNSQPIAGTADVRAGDVLRFGQTVVRLLGDVPAPAPVPRPVPAAVRPAEGGGNDDRQAARLKLVNDIHRALAAPISLSDLLDLILERSFEVLNPEEGVVLLRGPDGEFTPAATRTREGAGGEVFVSRRVVEEIVTKGKSVLVLDAALDERFSGSESLVMSGVRGVLAAPLSDAEGTMGLIALVSRVSVRPFSQQDLTMLESLAGAAALRVRNVALAEQAAARQVLERELALAHDIQMSMLPRRMPHRPEVDIVATLKPARSVGGDLYDFHLEGDRLWFIVGDVAGKGVGAALYMAVAKTLFRATVGGADDLGDVVRRMNRQLATDNDQLIFVTALVGYLVLPTGEVMLADAGHNPAVLIDRSGSLSLPEIPKCPALGVVEDADYPCGQFVLGPGESLLLYTDGATDARSPDGELYGDERLLASIAASAGRSPDDMLSSVLAAIDAFAAGGPPEDDVTLMVVKYRGERNGGTAIV